MTDHELTLNKCEHKVAWDNFVATSPQGNVFCQSSFLRALNVEYDLWVVLKKQETIAGAIIFRSGQEVLHAPLPFTMYQGVLLGNEILALASHTRSIWILKVTEFLLQNLSRRYDRVSFCLHHAFDDLRAFQWFHHQQPELGFFKIDLKYTGLLNLAKNRDFDTYLSNIRPTRRYEHRRAVKLGLTVEESKDVDILCSLHHKTFDRQGIELTQNERRWVRSITAEALQSGFGQLMLCREKSGECASATLFLHDDQCAYYMFGANNPDHLNLNGGTFLMLENIRFYIGRGLKWVDMVGVNSPNRGDFKTSFNPKVVPYFIATWDNPHPTD